jgi:hypothetical protein
MGEKKCIQNSGEEIAWKTTTGKTEDWRSVMLHHVLQKKAKGHGEGKWNEPFQGRALK